MVDGYFKLMGFKLVFIIPKAHKGVKDKWLQYIEQNFDFFLFLIVILSHKYVMN